MCCCISDHRHITSHQIKSNQRVSQLTLIDFLHLHTELHYSNDNYMLRVNMHSRHLNTASERQAG
jgi:AraC-like DNA-binding protein